MFGLKLHSGPHQNNLEGLIHIAIVKTYGEQLKRLLKDPKSARGPKCQIWHIIYVFFVFKLQC